MPVTPIILDRNRQLLRSLDIEKVVTDLMADTLTYLPQARFDRVISWRENGKPQENLIEHHPFKYPIRRLIASKQDFYTLQGLTQPLDHPRPHIYDVCWLLALWEERNPYVPAYAPKTLTTGVHIHLTDGHLIVSYRSVDHSEWGSVNYNPVNLAPRNAQNLRRVINFHLDGAHSDWLEVIEKPGYRPPYRSM